MYFSVYLYETVKLQLLQFQDASGAENPKDFRKAEMQTYTNNFLVMMTFREIPVPIPNTEVKPKCAENTCGLPCWEDRLLPDLYIPH